MPIVTYRQHDGTSQDVHVQIGYTLMEGARNADVRGIDADCGGACSCATCHVHIAPEWSARAGKPNALEDDLLDSASGRDETSRLSCQIKMRDDLDGIVVTVPAS